MFCTIDKYIRILTLSNKYRQLIPSVLPRPIPGMIYRIHCIFTKGIIYSPKVPVFGLWLYVYCRMAGTITPTLSYYNNNASSFNPLGLQPLNKTLYIFAIHTFTSIFISINKKSYKGLLTINLFIVSLWYQQKRVGTKGWDH